LVILIYSNLVEVKRIMRIHELSYAIKILYKFDYLKLQTNLGLAKKLKAPGVNKIGEHFNIIFKQIFVCMISN